MYHLGVLTSKMYHLRAFIHERNLICLPNQVSFGFIRLTPSDIVLRVDDE